MHKYDTIKRYLLMIIISCLLLLISGAIMLSYTTYDSHAAALELYGEIKSGKGTLSLSAKGGNVNWSATATENSDCGHNDLDPSGAWLGSDDVSISASLTAATGYHVRGMEIPEDGGYRDGIVSRSWTVNISRPSTTNVVRHVYGYFEPNAYNIIYNLNGGKHNSSATSSYHPDSARYDSSITLADPYKEGYSFKGWTGSNIDTSTARYGSKNYQSGADTKWSEPSTPVRQGYMWSGRFFITYFLNLTPTQDKDITLIANWTARTYTVTLDRQGTTNGSSSVTATYGSAMPSITPPTKTGYTFQGYYTGANGGGTKYYNSNGTSARNYDIAKSTTLYAYWTVNSYSVKFNGNGSTGGSMSNQIFTYNSAQNLKANGFTRYGYNFAGWSTTSSGGVVYNDKESVINLTSTNNGTVNLYAVWTPKTNCVLYFNSNLLSGATASISPTQKNVTFNGTYGTLATGTRTGYTLDGWYTTSACTTKVSTSTKVTSESQTVYAK